MSDHFFTGPFIYTHQSGIEPPHMAPEAIALSTELLVQQEYFNTKSSY